MATQGLKETDIYDVYNTGQAITFADDGLKGVEKKFKTLGIRIGFVYKLSNVNNEYVVLKTWKKKTL